MLKKRFKQLIASSALCFLCAAGVASQHKPMVEKPKEVVQGDVAALMQTVSAVHHFYYKDVPFKQLFSDAARGMLEELDPHSVFLDKKDLKALKASIDGHFVGIGVQISPDEGALRVVAPLDGSPAEKAGIKPNDLIIRVNGKPVTQYSLAKAAEAIRGKPGTSVLITVFRKGVDKPLDITVKRQKIKYESVTSRRVLDDIGYIRIAMFQGSVSELFKKAVTQLVGKHKDLKGLVLDLRANPGGLLDASIDVCNLMLTPADLKRYDGVIVSIKGRIKESNGVFRAQGSQLLKGVPIVVLIDGGSASASEIVAGAMQDYARALIVGTRSFGKGSVQTIIPLEKGMAVKLTTALYYTPAGRQIQAHGIIPDIYSPTLSISQKKSAAYFRFDESDFENHVKNGHASKEEKRRSKEASYHAKLLKLAEEDSGLYQAVMLLQEQEISSGY